jgi:hypothetical protein
MTWPLFFDRGEVARQIARWAERRAQFKKHAGAFCSLRLPLSLQASLTGSSAQSAAALVSARLNLRDGVSGLRKEGNRLNRAYWGSITVRSWSMASRFAREAYGGPILGFECGRDRNNPARIRPDRIFGSHTNQACGNHQYEDDGNESGSEEPNVAERYAARFAVA